MQLSNWARISGMLAVMAASSIVSGCVSTAEDIASHLAEKSVERRHLLSLVEGDLARYRSCLERRGGTCGADASAALPRAASLNPVPPVETAPGAALRSALDELSNDHPAKLAARTLGHPVLAQSVALYNQVRGHDSSRGSTAGSAGDAAARKKTAVMDVSVSQAQDFIEGAHRATAAGGWGDLADRAATALAQSRPGSQGHAKLVRDHRQAIYIEKYLAAFFRNGRFIAVDFTIEAAKAKQDLAGELERHTPAACRIFGAIHNQGSTTGAGSDGCEDLAASLYSALRGSSASIDKKLVKVSQTGFVSRDASYSAQFPVFAVDVDPSASRLISVTTQGAGAAGKIDLTAIGTDLAQILLEAVFDAHEGLPAVDHATGRELGAASLPLFEPSAASVSTADFNRMSEINQRSVIASGVILNRVIRGLGPFSLNNEPLEELIVTLITTSVKKAMAKATWCWYACHLEEDMEEVKHDIEGRLKKEAKRLAGEIGLDLKIRP